MSEQFVSAMFPLMITNSNVGFDQINKERLVKLINLHLEMVLYTRRGELPSQYNFGVGIEDYLFLNANEQPIINLAATVNEQVGKYLTYLTYFGVVVNTDELENHRLHLRIEYAVDNLDIREVLDVIVEQFF